MAKGYLFGFGFFLSLFTIFLLVVIVRALIRNINHRKVKVSLLKKYLKKITEEQKYEEADFINKLIGENVDDAEIRLPKEYLIISQRIIKFTKKGLKVKGKTRIIRVKVNDSKDNNNKDSTSKDKA